MRQGNFRFGLIAIGLAVMLAMPAGPLSQYAAANPRSRSAPRAERRSRSRRTIASTGPARATVPARCSATCSTSRPS